jgi:hypothetical protein
MVVALVGALERLLHWVALGEPCKGAHWVWAKMKQPHGHTGDGMTTARTKRMRHRGTGVTTIFGEEDVHGCEWRGVG